jgi:adhesin transport system outer membrane protein
VSAAPFEDELRALVAENPRIKSNEAQVKAADKGVKATLGPYLPSLDITGGAGYEYNSTPAFRAAGGPFDYNLRNYTATLKETIWDGGRRDANRRASKIQRDVSGLSLVNTRQTVLFEGASTYLNVLRQSELVELAQQNGENIRKQLNLEDERVRRGSGIAVDVLQAKSRLQISLERLVSSQGALQDSMSKYMQVHGHPADPRSMAVPPSVEKLLPTTLDEAIALAMNDNPNVGAFAKRIDLGVEAKRATSAEYFPTIDAVLQDKLEKDFEGAAGLRRDHQAKVTATWNLFNGFGTTSRAQQQAFDNDSRRSDYQETRRKVEETTRLAWQAYQTAMARVTLLENAVNIASEVFDARGKLRESGKETVINVLDAENEVYSARINYTSALYDSRVAAYQLLQAIGRLEVDNIIAVAAK